MPGQPSVSALKSAQAVNFFLQQDKDDPHSIEGDKYLKLVKLLWAADRLSLRNFGTSVTEDHYSALPYGPVALNTYNLIKACKPNSEIDGRWTSLEDAQWWKELFETRDHSLVLNGDPGSDFLAPSDVQMLETAYQLFRGTGAFQVADDISHNYPEWDRAFIPNGPKKAYSIDAANFFEDPEAIVDQHFQVDPEVLESARYLFNERQALSESIGVAM